MSTSSVAPGHSVYPTIHKGSRRPFIPRISLPSGAQVIDLTNADSENLTAGHQAVPSPVFGNVGKGGGGPAANTMASPRTPLGGGATIGMEAKGNSQHLTPAVVRRAASSSSNLRVTPSTTSLYSAANEDGFSFDGDLIRPLINNREADGESCKDKVGKVHEGIANNPMDALSVSQTGRNTIAPSSPPRQTITGTDDNNNEPPHTAAPEDGPQKLKNANPSHQLDRSPKPSLPPREMVAKSRVVDSRSANGVNGQQKLVSSGHHLLKDMRDQCALHNTGTSRQDPESPRRANQQGTKQEALCLLSGSSQLVKRVRPSTKTDASVMETGTAAPPSKKHRSSGTRVDMLYRADGAVRGRRPPPVDAEDHQYIVERVLACYIREGRKKYFVRWLGYVEDDDEEVDEDDIEESLKEGILPVPIEQVDVRVRRLIYAGLG